VRIPSDSRNYYDDIEAKYDLDASTDGCPRDNQILYDREGVGEFFQNLYAHFRRTFFLKLVERRTMKIWRPNAAVRLAAQTREFTTVGHAARLTRDIL